jgi:glutaminase
MTRAVIAAQRAAGPPAAAVGPDAIYRTLFDSFGPDKDGRISHWEMLTRLQRCGLQPGDPRIAEALAALTAADGSARRLDFGQFKALARRNSSLIRRAMEGNLAVPDFAALVGDIDRMYRELLPLRSGTVAGYIPQLAGVNPEQLAIAVCTVDGQRFAVGDAAAMFCLQSVSKTVAYCLALDETAPRRCTGTWAASRPASRSTSWR